MLPATPPGETETFLRVLRVLRGKALLRKPWQSLHYEGHEEIRVTTVPDFLESINGNSATPGTRITRSGADGFGGLSSSSRQYHATNVCFDQIGSNNVLPATPLEETESFFVSFVSFVVKALLKKPWQSLTTKVTRGHEEVAYQDISALLPIARLNLEKNEHLEPRSR